MDNMQQNGKCISWGDRDETVDHISESNKFVQKKYKTKHEWVRKIIHRELCKKLKFDHVTKWYKQKYGPIQENEMHKILQGSEIQTGHQVHLRRTD